VTPMNTLKGSSNSFRHYDAETGETLLRYDNYKEHSGSRHHIHFGEEKTTAVEFKNIQDHFKKFMKEVKKREGRKSS